MDVSPLPGFTMPPGGAMDILFSFDTTGSMSYILDEVKGRLSEMIQRLQADIPGIRIGVIAHGDYCDEKVFYLEKHIDFTHNVADLCNFVGEVEGTGGGDQDECYELVLRKANEDFNWAPVSNKVLVMIGDANPHEPDYELNVHNINWRDEVDILAKQGIKIYAVQALNNEGVEDFYKTMADKTGGHYLKLENFSSICDFIMAICYREKDDGLFMNYEAEVTARQGTSGLHKDLNNMFATLRRGDSVSSTSIPGCSICVSTAPHSPLPITHMDSIVSSTSDVSTKPKTIDLPKAPIPRAPKARPLKKRQPIPKNNSTKKSIPRENIPETKFALRNLKWTPWKLAYSPEKPEGPFHKMYLKNGFRRTKLFKSSTGTKVYEVAVQTRPRGKLHVMYHKITPLDLDQGSWERCLFQGSRRRVYVHRRQILRVIQQGCRVFIRKTDISKGQMKEVEKLNNYSYAWARSISGKKSPERAVIKNHKTLSGMDY
ncbi:uncharacterized protein LOC134263399 [Saccostrea cucullata]|uniref:uncharacterized protein LOC134263399 n=1 Tax=Saccostrea cuccullata TaxID=36930 RepID=UPI002ED48F7A